jgi:hypothetical protein
LDRACPEEIGGGRCLSPLFSLEGSPPRPLFAEYRGEVQITDGNPPSLMTRIPPTLKPNKSEKLGAGKAAIALTGIDSLL